MAFPSIVTQFVSNGSATTSTVTCSGTVTLGGNDMLVAFAVLPINENITGVSSSIDGAFSAPSSGGSVAGIESTNYLNINAFFLENPSAGAHTFTASKSSVGTARFHLIVVHVKDALQAEPQFTVGAFDSTDATHYSNSFNTSVNNALVLACGGSGGGVSATTNTITPDSPLTQVATVGLGIASAVANLAVSQTTAATSGTSITNGRTYDVTQRRGGMVAAVIPYPGTPTYTGSAFFAFMGAFQ